MVGVPSGVERYQHSDGIELRVRVTAEISYAVDGMSCGGILADA